MVIQERAGNPIPNVSKYRALTAGVFPHLPPFVRLRELQGLGLCFCSQSIGGIFAEWSIVFSPYFRLLVFCSNLLIALRKLIVNDLDG